MYIEFNVIGRVEKLVHSDFKGNISHKADHQQNFANTNEKWLQFWVLTSCEFGCIPVEIVSSVVFSDFFVVYGRFLMCLCLR